MSSITHSKPFIPLILQDFQSYPAANDQAHDQLAVGSNGINGIDWKQTNEVNAVNGKEPLAPAGRQLARSFDFGQDDLKSARKRLIESVNEYFTTEEKKCNLDHFENFVSGKYSCLMAGCQKE